MNDNYKLPMIIAGVIFGICCLFFGGIVVMMAMLNFNKPAKNPAPIVWQAPEPAQKTAPVEGAKVDSNSNIPSSSSKVRDIPIGTASKLDDNSRVICGIVDSILPRTIDKGYMLIMYFRKGQGDMKMNNKCTFFFDYRPSVVVGQKIVIGGMPTGLNKVPLGPYAGWHVTTFDNCKILGK